MKKFLLAAMLSLPLLTTTSACDGGGGGFTIPPKALEPGGAYVTYVQSTDCTGCNGIKRGDLIQSIDGTPVASAADVKAANILDGQPHELVVKRRKKGDWIDVSVSITASPNRSMPPLTDAPPFWTVSAAELNKAPEGWARRRLFGHASPQLLLVNVDGGLVNGRDLYGKKHVMVFFDWASQEDQRNATVVLKVLQQAQAPLNAKGIGVMLVQIKHPSERPRPAMNDTDLRQFYADNQATASEGGPLPPPPMYRSPNKTEDNPAQTLGLEGAFNYLENIGEAPNIFILDEFGIIRWHSAGATNADGDQNMVDVIVAAVKFAEANL